MGLWRPYDHSCEEDEGTIRDFATVSGERWGGRAFHPMGLKPPCHRTSLPLIPPQPANHTASGLCSDARALIAMQPKCPDQG